MAASYRLTMLSMRPPAKFRAPSSVCSFRCVSPVRTKGSCCMNKNGSLVAPEILVVDDEIDIRELMAGILADEGYETRVASDSDGTLAAIAHRRPHLVVLDVWLQGSRLDGI